MLSLFNENLLDEGDGADDGATSTAEGFNGVVVFDRAVLHKTVHPAAAHMLGSVCTATCHDTTKVAIIVHPAAVLLSVYRNR
jgi:hypothetical protein